MTEIPLKQWLHEEAERTGSTHKAVSVKFYRGRYPHLKLRRINARVVMVKLNDQAEPRGPDHDSQNTPGQKEPNT